MDDLRDFDLEIVHGLEGTSWEDAIPMMAIRTAHDPSVGIFGKIVSPSFHDMDDLEQWWINNKDTIIKEL